MTYAQLHTLDPDDDDNNKQVMKRFPAHDELGACRTSLVSPEQPNGDARIAMLHLEAMFFTFKRSVCRISFVEDLTGQIMLESHTSSTGLRCEDAQVQHTLCPAAHLFIYQLDTEDTGGLSTAFAEGPFRPFLHQPGLDGPVHVVGVQGSNGQHCLLGRAHREAWGVHGGPCWCWGWPAVHTSETQGT